MNPTLIDRVRERLAAESAPLRPDVVAAAIRAESGGVVGDTDVLTSLRVLQTELTGAGILEPLLCADDTTDVLVTGPDAVWVDDGNGLRRSSIRFTDEAAVRRLAQRLALAAGRRLDESQPWIDGHLTGLAGRGVGVRLHAILPPLAPGGTCLSMRVLRPATQDLPALARAGGIAPAAAALLERIIAARLAFLVTGGTGAGKTTIHLWHTIVMGTTGAIYARISQDRDGSRLGVERQEQDCRALADRLGWTILRLYTDNDVSAYSGKRRPAYADLLADIEANQVHGVVAWHPDRLHRSPLELEHYIDLSERFGVETHTVQAGRWDLSTPSGRAVARTLGAWARYESEHKGERIRRARQQQAKAGGWHGGIRPYGFEPDGVTIRPSEAIEIVRAAEAIVSGVSLRSIVRDLNSRGIPTATGRSLWTSVALRDIVVRPRTAGYSSYKGEIVGQAVWPPLVPEDTWRAARSILTDPARRTNGRGGTVRWLGSGLYVCGVCGEPKLRVGTGGTNKRHTYRCSNRDNTSTGSHVTREAHTLDCYIEDVIVARLSDPGVVEGLMTVDDGTDTVALRVEQVAIRERQDEVAGLFAAGEITGRQLATATEQLTAKADEIAKTLAAVGLRSPLDDLANAADLRARWFGTQPDRSDGLALGNRRAILETLATVTVLPAGRQTGGFDPTYIEIKWRML